MFWKKLYGLSSGTWAYKWRGGEWDQQNPWALVSTAEREQGDGKRWYVRCDTPAGFSTLQSKHSAATQQILALFQGNKQKTKLSIQTIRWKQLETLIQVFFSFPAQIFLEWRKKPSFPKESP